MRWRSRFVFLLVTLASPLVFAEPSATQRAQLRQAELTTLQDGLQLDRPTAARMQSVVDKYKARLAPLRRADGALLRQMRDQLQLSSPDPKRVKSLAVELIKNRERLQALRDERLRELQKTLSPTQFARLLVSWPQLSRALSDDARKLLRS
jgi:hypothetical protein